MIVPSYSRIASLFNQADWQKHTILLGGKRRGSFSRVVLYQWDPALLTFLETDCSGFALVGVLSQEVNRV